MKYLEVSMGTLVADARATAPAAVSWPKFNWEDPLLLDASLTGEERLVRDSARAFANEHLMPIVRESNRHETYDRALMQRFGEAGLLGPTIEGYGCAGTSYVA